MNRPDMEPITEFLKKSPFINQIISEPYINNQSSSREYFLVETGRYEEYFKIIDTSIFKERLEAKAKRFNELAKSNNNHDLYYEVKTLEKGFYDTENNSRPQN
jgi:hypothetical protein